MCYFKTICKNLKVKLTHNFKVESNDPEDEARTTILPVNSTCGKPYDSFYNFEQDCYAILEGMKNFKV